MTYKSFISTVLAAALAITTLSTAPAKADNTAEIIAGVAALALLGVVISEAMDDDDPVYVTRNPYPRHNVYRPNVYRPNVYRPNVYRPNVYRPNVYRPNVHRNNRYSNNHYHQKPHKKHRVRNHRAKHKYYHFRKNRRNGAP